MTITTKLTRAAAVCAALGGLLFVTVQIAHPALDLALVTTTEWKVRQSMKVLFQIINTTTGDVVSAWYTCSGGTCETQ